MDNKISGIKCEVENCVHHSSCDVCTANLVEIKSDSATTERETFCKTFKCKNCDLQ